MYYKEEKPTIFRYELILMPKIRNDVIVVASAIVLDCYLRSLWLPDPYHRRLFAFVQIHISYIFISYIPLSLIYGRFFRKSDTKKNIWERQLWVVERSFYFETRREHERPKTSFDEQIREKEREREQRRFGCRLLRCRLNNGKISCLSILLKKFSENVIGVDVHNEDKRWVKLCEMAWCGWIWMARS